MIGRMWVLVMLGFMLSLPMNLPGEEGPMVHLAGLRIVGSGYGMNGTELKAFHQQSGTSLVLAVKAPKDRMIVEVDDNKCALTQFTDNLGQNLMDGINWSGFPEITKDGRHALVEVKSKSRPSKTASKLVAAGTVSLRIASSKHTEKMDNLKLEPGVQATVGQYNIQVLKVQKENDGLALWMQVDRKFMKNMKDIRFFTPDGTSVEIWGRGSLSFGNASQLEFNLNMKSVPETLTVEIDIWQELEALDLPFKIETGVGF